VLDVVPWTKRRSLRSIPPSIKWPSSVRVFVCEDKRVACHDAATLPRS